MQDEWRWQGFFGPAATANAAKIKADAAPLEAVGVVVPERGAACVPVDDGGSVLMFAVQTRASAPWPTPAGLSVARAEIVGRLVGA